VLSDLERKVLTIIRNTCMRLGRLPSIKDLTIRTGRSEKDLYDVLELDRTEVHWVEQGESKWNPSGGAGTENRNWWENQWAMKNRHVLYVVTNYIGEMESGSVLFAGFGIYFEGMIRAT